MQSVKFSGVSSNFRPKNQEVISSALNVQSPSQTTRAQIFEAYVRIAVNEGSSAVSLTRLAEELKISKQLVRYHISDLDQASHELFKIIVESASTYIRSRVNAAHTWKEQLYTWAEANFEWFMAYPEFGKFLLFMYHRASVDEEVRVLHEKVVSAGRSRVFDFLNQSNERSLKKNADMLSSLIHQSATALIIQMLSLDDLKNFQKYKKQLSQQIDFLLKKE